MKNTLILMLLPVASIAQQKTDNSASNKPFLKVHFSKLFMTTEVPSCMTVYDGDFLLTDTLPAEKLPAKRKWQKIIPTHCADNVAISYNYSHVLRGDRMVYDNVQKKAVLKGNVTLSRNGVDELIGKYALVDLSDNRYVIEKLK